MIHSGENLVRGVPVTVTRRRARRINIRVSADGRVGLTVPYHWATLAEAEAFLLSKWDWVEKTRRAAQANPAPAKTPVAAAERARLEALLGELHAAWCLRLGEAGVAWKLRAMKSIWGPKIPAFIAWGPLHPREHSPPPQQWKQRNGHVEF